MYVLSNQQFETILYSVYNKGREKQLAWQACFDE